MKYIYYTLTLGLLTLFSCSQENNENQNAKQSKDLSIPNDLSNYIPLSEVLYIRNSSYATDNYYCLKKDSSKLNGTGFYFATMKMQHPIIQKALRHVIFSWSSWAPTEVEKFFTEEYPNWPNWMKDAHKKGKKRYNK